MQFIARKRRHTPTVIIIALIDVLMVVLIFLMVTTTFKQQPAVKLVLPESSQAKAGASDNTLLVITVPGSGPLYLGETPVTIQALQQRLTEAVRQDPATSVAIRADTNAPFVEIVKVMDAAKAANIKVVSAFTRAAGTK